MTRRRKWILFPLAAVALLLVVLVVLFDWSWLKGIAEDQASAALGRPVTIGELQVDLGLVPTITVRDVEVANADWASDEPMAHVPRAAAELDLLALLGGDLVLPRISVEEPDLLLEQGDGRTNWQMGGDDQQSSGSGPSIPVIGDLEVSGATVRYVDRVANREVLTRLDTIEGRAPEAGEIRLTAQGAVDDAPLDLAFTGQSRDLVTDGGAPTPFTLDATFGEQTIAIDGTSSDIAQAAALEASIAVDGRPPDGIVRLLGLKPDALPEIDFNAEIAREGETLRIVQVEARFGDSDLSGQGELGLGEGPLAVTGQFRSDQVDVGQLKALWAEQTTDRGEIENALDDAEAALEEVQAGRALDRQQGPVKEQAAEVEATAETGLPRLPFSFDQLPPWNVDVTYEAGRIRAADFQVEGLEAEARLKDKIPALSAQASGTYGGQSMVLDVRLGPERGVEASPFPLAATIEAGETNLNLDGAIQRPEALRGIDLRFDAASSDLNEILAAAGVQAPPVPAFQASGRLVQEEETIALRDFEGSVGDSSLQGEASVDRSQPAPLLTARITADQLYASDFLPAEQDQDAASEQQGEQQGSSLIRDGRLNLDALPELDLDIEFEADVLEVPEFHFEPVRIDFRLVDKTPIVAASGEGSFRDEALDFDVTLGDERYLEDTSVPFPMDIRLNVADTRLRAEGTVAKPDGLTGLDVDVDLEGENLDRLGDVLQISLPATPPYALAGQLTHQEQTWTLDGLQGRVGDSDLDGRFSIDLAPERPTILADLHSANLDFDDLAPLIGAPGDVDETASEKQANEAEQASQEDRLFPDAEIEVSDLRMMDARVTFRGENVDAPKLPLQSAYIELVLENGKLQLKPLRFALAGGTLESTIELDATPRPIEGSFDIAMREVDVQKLLGNFDIEIAEIETQKEGQGLLFGRTQLDVAGNSIAEMLGQANGEFGLIMDGGRVNALIVEALGLDIGEALGLLVAEEEERKQAMVPVHCLVANFGVSGGVMESKALVLDTEDSKIVGAGKISLDDEQFDLRFKALPRDNSVLSAGTPVRVTGSLASPSVEVVSDDLIEKGFAAAALGVVLPVVGAVIPFVEMGEKVPNNCNALIEQAQDAAGSSQPDGSSEATPN